jgi:hypothetical protein
MHELKISKFVNWQISKCSDCSICKVIHYSFIISLLSHYHISLLISLPYFAALRLIKPLLHIKMIAALVPARTAFGALHIPNARKAQGKGRMAKGLSAVRFQLLVFLIINHKDHKGLTQRLQ